MRQIFVFQSWCFYISRIICFECSFIAVPLPTSKDNHQLENANFYKDHNCCWVIEQKDFENEIERYLKDILSEEMNFKKKRKFEKIKFSKFIVNVNQKILKNLNKIN